MWNFKLLCAQNLPSNLQLVTEFNTCNSKVRVKGKFMYWYLHHFKALPNYRAAFAFCNASKIFKTHPITVSPIWSQSQQKDWLCHHLHTGMATLYWQLVHIPASHSLCQHHKWFRCKMKQVIGGGAWQTQVCMWKIRRLPNRDKNLHPQNIPLCNISLLR